MRLYTPLLYYWARQTGLRPQDAEDLVQDVFALLVRKLLEFRYEPGGSFRNWLRTVALNKWRERCRREAGAPRANGDHLDQVAAPDEMRAFEETEYREHLVHSALQIIRSEFSESAWKAFHEHVIAGRDAAVVAAELNLRVGSVYAAKSRILTRLRRELTGLID